MSLLPEILNLHLEALAVGLLYRLRFFTLKCLLHATSYIVGIGADFRKGVLVTLTYNSGSVAAYAGTDTLVFAGIFTVATATTANNP